MGDDAVDGSDAQLDIGQGHVGVGRGHQGVAPGAAVDGVGAARHGDDVVQRITGDHPARLASNHIFNIQIHEGNLQPAHRDRLERSNGRKVDADGNIERGEVEGVLPVTTIDED